jgi:UDP-glucose 4-epimerase
MALTAPLPRRILVTGAGGFIGRRFTTRLAETGHAVQLLGAAGCPRWGALPDRPLERPVVADVEGTRRLTGWAPRVTLEEGLADTIAWYRAVPSAG